MTDSALWEFVRLGLVHSLKDVQLNGGRDVPEITNETVPFNDLPGFDSYSGVEASVFISERIAVEVDTLTFVDPSTGRLLTVKEIVDATVNEHRSRIVAGQAKSTSSPSTAA